VTEKTKSGIAREGRESQDKPPMMNRLSITTKEDHELHVGSGRGIDMIKRHKTKKRRGVDRMERRHRA
jgi:hypothetical protein